MRRPLEDAALRRPLRLAIWVVAGAVATVVRGENSGAVSAGPREYSSGGWSRSFFKPSQVQIEGVGLVNEESVFIATRSGIKTLHQGRLTPLIGVGEDEVTAFHLCHHRGSLFYEVLSRDGGALSIFEYSLSARKEVLVHEFQDAPPAAALACVDQWLLLASPSSLQAVHLSGDGEVSELRRFEEHDPTEPPISSLSVAYAADVVGRAEVFAAVPVNATILRLRLRDEGGGILSVEDTELLLPAGDGADGPVAEATVRSPGQLLWTRGQVLFTDGCSLRELRQGRVRTLLGSPGDCTAAANETLEPVPWGAQLSRPRALVAPAEGTAGTAVLLLTEAQVVRVSERANSCSGPSREEAATGASCQADQRGCAWAEGPAGEALCFECATLTRWAAALRPPIEACSLELEPRAGTRYALGGCGCAPPTTPEPPAPDDGGGDDGAGGRQAVLSVLLVVAAAIAGVCLHRRSRRRAAAMRDLYGADTAEFHMFTDNDCGQ